MLSKTPLDPNQPESPFPPVLLSALSPKDGNGRQGKAKRRAERNGSFSCGLSISQLEPRRCFLMVAEKFEKRLDWFWQRNVDYRYSVSITKPTGYNARTVT